MKKANIVLAVLLGILVIVIVYYIFGTDMKVDAAAAREGKYEEALADFLSLGDYGDAGQRTLEMHYALAENAAAQRYAFVNAHIVLQLAAIADHGALPHIGILADGALFADPCSTLHMAEMPYLGAFANLRALIHYGGGMNIHAHRPNRPSKSVVAQS